MKVSLKFSALVLAAGAAVSTASATPTGSLSIANVFTGGGVIVSASGIDFYPPSNVAANGVGDFATGGSTSINYGRGSTLTATTNPYGQMKDIQTNTGPIPNFIQFYTGVVLPSPPGTGPLTSAPVFDLTQFLPGGAAQGALSNCAGVVAVGVSCSPLVTIGFTTFVSPFVLTNRGSYTDVSLGLQLLGRDGAGPNSVWFGGFTAQVIGLPPSAIQAMFNSGGSINNTLSATFVSQAVPEPATLSLIGTGLALAYLFGRRFRH
jgi:PEP-CTERM motif